HRLRGGAGHGLLRLLAKGDAPPARPVRRGAGPQPGRRAELPPGPGRRPALAIAAHPVLVPAPGDAPRPVPPVPAVRLLEGPRHAQARPARLLAARRPTGLCAGDGPGLAARARVAAPPLGVPVVPWVLRGSERPVLAPRGGIVRDGFGPRDAARVLNLS